MLLALDAVSQQVASLVSTQVISTHTASRLSASVISLLGMYGNIASSEVAVGEAPVETIHTAFRISSAATDPAQGEATVAVPTTAMEKLTGQNVVSSITLSNQPTSTAPPSVQFSVVSMKARNFGNTSVMGFQSNPLLVRGKGLESVHMTLVRNKEIQFISTASTVSFNTTCIENIV